MPVVIDTPHCRVFFRGSFAQLTGVEFAVFKLVWQRWKTGVSDVRVRALLGGLFVPYKTRGLNARNPVRAMYSVFAKINDKLAHMCLRVRLDKDGKRRLEMWTRFERGQQPLARTKLWQS